jgi:hypothetical protein
MRDGNAGRRTGPPLARIFAVAFATVASIFVCWVVGSLLRLNHPSETSIIVQVSLVPTQAERAERLSKIPLPGKLAPLIAQEFSSSSSNNLTPQALDPVQIARDRNAIDPQLVEWLTHWRNRWQAGEEISRAEQGNLADLLSVTTLSSVDLLEIAHAFHFLSNDAVTSAIFYQAASFRAETELTRTTETSEQRLAVLRAIDFHMQDFKDVLWDMVDNHQAVQYAGVIYSFYSDLTRWAPSGDQRLTAASIRCQVGMAECLDLMGRTTDAIKLLEGARVNMQQAPDGGPEAWNWAYAMALRNAHRDKEAIEPLKSCASDPGFRYSSEAWKFLILTYATVGEKAKAEWAFDQWAMKYRPSVNDAAAILGVMEQTPRG